MSTHQMPLAKKRKYPLQVRIDRDLESAVHESATKNSRTAPREVNHVLRGVYFSAVSVRTPTEQAMRDFRRERKT